MEAVDVARENDVDMLVHQRGHHVRRAPDHGVDRRAFDVHERMVADENPHFFVRSRAELVVSELNLVRPIMPLAQFQCGTNGRAV